MQVTRARGWEAWWLAVPVLVILTWPVTTISPRAGLDSSWQAALHLGATQRLEWGTGLVFTYGPLGFLDVPQLWAAPTFLLASVYVAAVTLALCATVFALLLRKVPGVVAFLLSWVAGTMARMVRPAELVAVILCLLSLAALNGVLSTRAVRWLVAISPVVAALQLLVKFNTGLACSAIVVVTAWRLAPAGIKGLALAACSGTGALAALWLATGGSPVALVAFVIRSLAVASGYSQAMALESPQALWQYPAAVLLFAVSGWLLWTLGCRRQRTATLLLVVPFAYLQAKRSFVRHDLLNGQSMFLAFALLPLALSWRGRARGGAPALIALTALASCALLVSQVMGAREGWNATIDTPALSRRASVERAFNPARPPIRFGTQAADVLLRHRRQRMLEAARSEMRGNLGLEGLSSEDLRGSTVHIDPYETSAAWLLDVDNWYPVPVFQTYSAFTDELDRLNADSLSRPAGPERILRPRRALAIDGRSPLFESPRYTLRMVCGYSEIGGNAAWQVLDRTKDRCGRPFRLATLHARSGDHVAVPKAKPEELVYVRLSLPSASPLRSFRDLVLKPRSYPVVTMDGREFRLVAATADGPLLLSVPPGSDVPATSTGFVTERIAVDNLEGLVTFGFYAVPRVAGQG